MSSLLRHLMNTILFANNVTYGNKLIRFNNNDETLVDAPNIAPKLQKAGK